MHQGHHTRWRGGSWPVRPRCNPHATNQKLHVMEALHPISCQHDANIGIYRSEKREWETWEGENKPNSNTITPSPHIDVNLIYFTEASIPKPRGVGGSIFTHKLNKSCCSMPIPWTVANISCLFVDPGKACLEGVGCQPYSLKTTSWNSINDNSITGGVQKMRQLTPFSVHIPSHMEAH